VAADSESNLRIFRSSGASRVAPAGLSALSPVPVGNVVVAASDAAACSPRESSDRNAPPGSRHRRAAPERA